jgi:hypothetical protein
MQQLGMGGASYESMAWAYDRLAAFLDADFAGVAQLHERYRGIAAIRCSDYQPYTLKIFGDSELKW